ncbi:hypothetical protein BC938DRAFT_477661 [Jimgerdemannia flammicorona]|uniref:Uncharacterized protein n=1 Tax=Jimgerdemannia flammicorona TaxID=994334 RepID=A0A433QP09_9FUNG|nr:hypothetical protein BC938DRAFT_477661 [Jimgerdemannia flammicorona]
MDTTKLQIPFYTKSLLINYKGESWNRTYTLHYHNLMDVIHKLLTSLCFQDCMEYQSIIINNQNRDHCYGELHWSEYWWHMQDSLNIKGTTVILILLSIDEIHLNILGQQKAYPVYLMIRNIPKKYQ